VYVVLLHVQRFVNLNEEFLEFLTNIKKKGKGEKRTLEGGLEPPTLWLTATRSNQLSYSSRCEQLLFSSINSYILCLEIALRLLGSVTVRADERKMNV
jgi:hypothetical protein